VERPENYETKIDVKNRSPAGSKPSYKSFFWGNAAGPESRVTVVKRLGGTGPGEGRFLGNKAKFPKQKFQTGKRGGKGWEISHRGV